MAEKQEGNQLHAEGDKEWGGLDFFNSPGLKIQSIQETGANQPNHLPPNSASKMSAQPYDTRDQASGTKPLGGTPYPNYSRQAGSRRQPDTPEGNQGTDGSFTQEA